MFDRQNWEDMHEMKEEQGYQQNARVGKNLGTFGRREVSQVPLKSRRRPSAFWGTDYGTRLFLNL